jgi:ABC-type thiamin/hydroxymethylpyrimidine transport system permease subunit
MKLIFGGLISILLLGIYVHLIIVAIRVVYCVAPACTAFPPDYFNEGMAQALSVVGGLVSALVIAELAITKPGHAPATRALAPSSSVGAVRTVSIVSVCYVMVWLAAGMTAFFVGLYHPKSLPVLTTLGQAWLGLAVSSAYAYFGLAPNGEAG